MAAETAQQARNLLNETRDQVREQARTGQQKAAEKLSSVADELRGMAEKSDQPGLASDLAVQAADKVRDVASWLQGRDPGELLVEVRNWARRRPAAFLAGAAIAGVLVGRLTRAAAAAQSESSNGNGAAQLPVSPQPSAPGGSGLGYAGPSPGYEPSPPARPRAVGAGLFRTHRLPHTGGRARTGPGTRISAAASATGELPAPAPAASRVPAGRGAGRPGVGVRPGWAGRAMNTSLPAGVREPLVRAYPDAPGTTGDAAAHVPGLTAPSDSAGDRRESLSDVSIGELIGDVSRDLSTLMRQELELAKAEVKQEAKKSGKVAGMLGGAGYAAHLTVLFLSFALWWGLANVIDEGLAALIVAALWAIVGAVLYAVGRRQLREINPKPERTVETLREVPDALKGR